MSASNPFPAPATTKGYQTISSTCSETEKIRLASGNLLKTVSIVKVSTLGLSLSFVLTYNAQISTATASPVGDKWRHNYMRSLVIGGSLVTYIDPSGRNYNFVPSGSNWVPDTTSYYTPGTLVENASNWQMQFPDGSVHTFNSTGQLVSSSDRMGNMTSFQYTSGALTSIIEPTGRSIQLAYTGSFITTVTDPNGNQTTLIYDTSNNNLTEVMGPAGCVLQYGYTTPSNHLITSRTDPNGNVYTYGYNGSQQLTSVVDAESPSHTITYAYDTVDEYVGDNPVSTQTFTRTTLTDTFSNAWEYRFDQSGMLWRLIQPIDTTNSIYHWQRFYWDNNQQLLFASTGHPLINNYSSMGNMAGPRDCTNNTFRRRTTDPTLAVPLQHADANGKLTNFTFNSARRMTSKAVGQGHLGVQGNWVGHYGADGYLLCAFDSTSADVQTLPSYISSVSMGTATRQRLDDSSYYDHLMDPRTPVHPTTLHKGNGYWQSGSAFTMTVTPTSGTPTSFNLSFYTNSTDLAYSSSTPLYYNEQMGRDVTFSVTDNNGTRTFRVTNNAMGHWVTFPVQADSGNPVSITLSPTGANALSASPDVRISAVMFDPTDNHQTSYTYDESNNLATVTDGLGNTASAVYNANGTLRSGTDANGNTTLYFYEDAYQNLTRVQDPYGNNTRMVYDKNGNVLSKTDANGHTTVYTYDDKNRVLTTTNPLGYVTTNQYDSAGNISVVTDANGNQTQYFYTPTNRLKKVTDAASQSTEKAYDSGGNLYTVTDPDTNVTTYSYDNANRLLQTTRADGSIVSQAYDTQNNVVATTSPNGNQATVADISLTGAANFFRNPGAEIVDQTSTNVAQGWPWVGTGTLDTTRGHSGQNSLLLQTTTTSFAQYFFQPTVMFPAGGRGLASFWALPDGSTNPSSVQGSAVVFQVDGSLVETQSPAMSLPTSSSTWEELPLFRVDVPGSSQYPLSPISNFRAYGVSTANTPDVWFDDFALYCLSVGKSFDNEGRLVATQSPDGTRTQRLYDRYGRLFQTLDAKGNVTQMGYDSLNRLTSATDALGNVTQFGYDAMGNKTSVTDPNANVTQSVYDKNNRRVQIIYPDSTTELFGFDAVGNTVSYTNNRGQLFTMTYDAANRLVERLYHTDNSTVLYGYDPAGNPISRIERNGDVCWYNYDVVNRLVAVERDPAPGTFSPTSSWLQRSVYDAASNRTEFDNGTGASGGVYGTDVYGTGTYATPPTQWTVPSGGYDDMNRLTAYQDASSNETTVSYDIESRVSGITYPNGSPAVASTLTYDILSRLLSSDTVMGATSILSLQYGYDQNSNRVGAATGSDAWYYTVDAANQLVQEDLDRFVERSYTKFRWGALANLDISAGTLSLIAVNDPFSSSLLDLDRWNTTYTSQSFDGGMEIRQYGSLLLTFPRGFCSTLANTGSGSTTAPPISFFGLSGSYVWGGLQHRVPLTGDFDIQVTFNDFQGYPQGYTNSAVTLMVTNTSVADVLDNGGNSFMVLRIDGTPEYHSYISNNATITDATVATTDIDGILRLVRSGTTVTAYYWDSSAWQTLSTVTGYVTDTMYAGVVLENFGVFASASLSTFQSNLSAVQYGTSGTYTSATFDAGQSVTWDSIQWAATVPAGATLQFQIATSSSATGPFTFVGPDGTSATYFTTSGTSIYTGTTGRYAQYQATLTGNGSVTPSVSRVDVLFAGSNTSTEYTYTYDGASNMTGKVTEVAGSTTVTETRTINALNQITANAVVGATTTNWSFAFDNSGNMQTRTNVTLSETTTYTWDEDNRLTQVQLPGGATVSYTYDVLGRMLSRTDTSGTTTFVWDGMNCIQETDYLGNVTRYYSPNGMLMSFDRTVSAVTSTYQIHADGLGSIRKVTDSSGSVVATFDYDSWGNQLASTSDSIPNGGLQYRFVGALGVRWEKRPGNAG